MCFSLFKILYREIPNKRALISIINWSTTIGKVNFKKQDQLLSNFCKFVKTVMFLNAKEPR